MVDNTSHQFPSDELLRSIQIMLAVEEDQLQLHGECPILETYQTQLFQVFMNLIGNGYKYHEGKDTAVVTVSIGTSPLPGFHRFEVSDNGPGIDAKYHQKIRSTVVIDRVLPQ